LADSDDDVDRHDDEDQASQKLPLQSSPQERRIDTEKSVAPWRRTDTEKSVAAAPWSRIDTDKNVSATKPQLALEQSGGQQERKIDTKKVAEKGNGKGWTEGKGKSISKSDKGESEGKAKGADKFEKRDSKGDTKGKGKNGSKGTCKGVMSSSGREKGKGRGKGACNEKCQCQFIIGIGEDPKFRVAKRILGSGGIHMKSIAEKSGARLRLRGKGSNFLEGPQQKESEDDLMLCVSCEDVDGYEAAKTAVTELIESIHAQYRAFRQKSGLACPSLQLQINEGYREGSR